MLTSELTGLDQNYLLNGWQTFDVLCSRLWVALQTELSSGYIQHHDEYNKKKTGMNCEILYEIVIIDASFFLKTKLLQTH